MYTEFCQKAYYASVSLDFFLLHFLNLPSLFSLPASPHKPHSQLLIFLASDFTRSEEISGEFPQAACLAFTCPPASAPVHWVSPPYNRMIYPSMYLIKDKGPLRISSLSSCNFSLFLELFLISSKFIIICPILQ